MDSDTARNLFHEGGVLYVADTPVGTEFGIDYNSWNTGERFKGVKMIPPGLHFVFFRSRAIGSSTHSAALLTSGMAALVQGLGFSITSAPNM